MENGARSGTETDNCDLLRIVGLRSGITLIFEMWIKTENIID